ncbi:MAG: hypothetical protein Kow0062_02240 [Acidobacteriota bacterium]
MARRSRRSEIVSFKADADLVEAMRGIPNRSEFIRAAILAALDGVCPVCRGTGILTGPQQEHWREFARRHSVEDCADCHEPVLVCHAADGAASGPPPAGPEDAR